jgi:hypothetical protein
VGANEKSFARTGSEVSKRRTLYLGLKLRQVRFGVTNLPRE